MTLLTTTLTAVTVYPDRARLTRRGEITLEAGTHRLEISALPLQMNPDSARASARGAAYARLSGLQVQRVFYPETPAEQVHELEVQMEAVQDDLHKFEAQIELVGQQRAKIDALAGHTERYARALARGQMTIETQLALFDDLRGRAETLDAERQGLLVQKRTLERRQQQLKNQLDQVRSARPRERYSAFVEVEVLQGGSLSFDLSYVVDGAGWKPLYDLRLVEENGQSLLEVGYLAQVMQQSSESWNQVELNLSTARPALAATVPELTPWYVGPLPPVQPRAMRMAEAPATFAMAAKAMPEGLAAAPAMEKEAEEALARVDTSGAAITYHVPGRVDIPADGAPHKVSVARFALPPTLDYVTAPRLVEAAYRRAKVVNESPYTLLSGTANLFAGSEFFGATRLELTAPQGEIELYLGADDRVKVERELKRREVDKSLIGGKRRIHYGYEIRIENSLAVECNLVLHDQMPVSRHEEVKVRLDSAEPKPATQSELNLLDWELKLAPKEKRAIRFDYTVEYPQEMEVAGLP